MQCCVPELYHAARGRFFDVYVVKIDILQAYLLKLLPSVKCFAAIVPSTKIYLSSYGTAIYSHLYQPKNMMLYNK